MRQFHTVDSLPDGRLVIRVITPIPVRTLAGEARLLVLSQPVPESFGRHADAVQEAYREYQQLTLGRSGLKRIYTVTLSLTLLLALLGALAFAMALFTAVVFCAGVFAIARSCQEPMLAIVQALGFPLLREPWERCRATSRHTSRGWKRSLVRV